MVELIWAIVLIVVALMAVALNKTYNHLPLRELKRQARANHDDNVAKVLYRAAAYGLSLQAFLLCIALLAVGGSVVMYFSALAVWAAFLLTVASIWLVFLWLPYTFLSRTETRISIWLTPAVGYVLHYIHRPFAFIGRGLHGITDIQPNAAIYEVDDLLGILNEQKHHPGNRIPDEDLEMAARALVFSKLKVSDVYIPRTSVNCVDSKDTIGPMLMDELHKSGHHTFPVVTGKPEQVVGVVSLTDLIDVKQKAAVSSVMQKTVRYVHEDLPLDKILNEFLRTGQNMFVVVNSFEEFAGILTISDVLGQVIGRYHGDESDTRAKDNPRAAAEALAKKEHTERQLADIELSE
jgi:CBS domain containing-hemolysin-like protein